MAARDCERDRRDDETRQYEHRKEPRPLIGEPGADNRR
jgi:hypothetical protein